MVDVEPRRLQNRCGPAALTDIEPERSGRVRHVLDHLAGQPIADIGFWQQHLGYSCEDFWLVARDPHQLGGGEARHRKIAGNPVQQRTVLRELDAFGMSAAVIPENGRTQGPIVRAEQRGTVHLAR